MKTACLQTSYFPQDHTGEHIAEALQDALTKLNEKELVAIMTDNGSNVIKGMELQKWLRMQCSLVTDFIWALDIEVLESIQKALKPLQDITDALSGEEYVTISYVRPVLHLFNKSPGT
ncbi:unnamed protein product [Leuciscus chuanchicus]